MNAAVMLAVRALRAPDISHVLMPKKLVQARVAYQMRTCRAEFGWKWLVATVWKRMNALWQNHDRFSALCLQELRCIEFYLALPRDETAVTVAAAAAAASKARAARC